jgi:hypothetical protein
MIPRALLIFVLAVAASIAVPSTQPLAKTRTPVTQTVTGNEAVVADNARVLIIRRVAPPAATRLRLPSVKKRDGRSLLIVDWSTGGVASHEIILIPAGEESVVRQASYRFYSVGDSLGSIQLFPITEVNGWAR